MQFTDSHKSHSVEASADRVIQNAFTLQTPVQWLSLAHNHLYIILLALCGTERNLCLLSLFWKNSVCLLADNQPQSDLSDIISYPPCLLFSLSININQYYLMLCFRISSVCETMASKKVKKNKVMWKHAKRKHKKRQFIKSAHFYTTNLLCFLFLTGRDSFSILFLFIFMSFFALELQ